MKKSVIVVVCLLLVGIFGWSIAKANSADIKVHLGAGTIVMDQQVLVLTPDEAIMVQEDTVYLPLRPLMEKMDYQVFWDAGMQNVSMEKGDQTSFMTIGSNQYVRNGQTITLDNAPILVNGKTMVPVTFFTNVMNKTVEVSNSHV